MQRIGILILLASGSVPGMAVAQTAPAPKPAPAQSSAPADDQSDTDEPDIIVKGQRNLPGAVIGDIPPEQQLGPADIRSYGVSSVSDLLNELSPQTTSGRGSGGAPVVLLNGKRISSFSEIRDIPTEAIARVDILPEEVALKYGFRADQKVVNIVLRRRFRATTVELADKAPTAGGRNNAQGELDLLHIRGDGRFNLHMSYQANSALTESERDINSQPGNFAIGGNVLGTAGVNHDEIDPALSALAGMPVTIAGVPASAGTTAPSLGTFISTANVANTTDQGAYRTLLPSSRDFSANTSYARPIFGNVSATINGRLEVTDSISTNGLPSVSFDVPTGSPFSPFGTDVTVDRAIPGYLPLRQQNSAVTAHLGTSFNGTISPKWRWSLTANYDHSDTKTVTETGLDTAAFQARINAGDPTANPFGPLIGLGASAANRAYATSNEAGFDALFNGPLFKLPAGDISTSIRVGADTNSFDTRSYRAASTQIGSVSRGTVNGQVNIDVPIASRNNNFLPFLGKLSGNFNIAEDHFSDFGTLETIGYGANWAPIDAIRIIASHTDQDQAPSPQQLGNPVITTPNVRVFDYVLGTTANVTTLTGGNPALIADNNHVTKIGLTVKPWSQKDFTFTASYVTSRTDNPIAAFPSATAAIEAAFPSRFTRDSNGALTRIDMRPINFAESDRSELRWGINFSKPLKSKIQKEMEAFRAGTGPNPLAGLQLPRAFQRRGGNNGATPDGSAMNGGTPAAPVQNGAAPGAGGQDGTAPAAGGDGGRGGGRPGGGFGGRGGGGGGGRGGFGGGGQGGGRLQFALYHTWHFKDEVLVQQGGPRLDLLNGDAIGGSGGQSRHEFEAQAGYTNNGTGFRLSGNYKTGTQVNGGTPGAPEPLDFSGLGTIDLRLFADLGQKLELIKKHPWMRGARITLSVGNIFDSRQRVTDATGATPISYQPDYLDPLGRTVRLSIRKLFF
jgi:iron complex outermembrane receptor protein